MITLKPAKAANAVMVTFTVPAQDPDGRNLCVVGDFNEWNPMRTPMDRSRDTHTATVRLDPGVRYRFRYLCENGEWFNDEAAHAYEPNPHGGDDGVVDLTGYDFSPDA
jgi:1,4-alpha-glucan branching enzyme